MEVDRLRLRDEDPVGAQRLLAQRVELVLEEARGRADRVGEVDHDHVELALQLGDRLERVARPHLDPRIAERETRHFVVLARDVHDLLVELEQVDALDARMLEHLGDEMHVAAADHRDRTRIRVGEQRGVGEHLVVHVRVEVGHLHDAVEREDATEPRRLEQHDVLELGAALLEHHGHVVGRVRRAAGLELLEPAFGVFGRHTPREVPDVDAFGFERLPQHADDRLHVDVRAAGEEVGGHVAVLRPGVEREVALGDDRDTGDAVGRELVHEDVDERDPARGGRRPQRFLRPLHGVEVRSTPELANCVATDPSCVQPSPPAAYETGHVICGQTASWHRAGEHSRKCTGGAAL